MRTNLIRLSIAASCLLIPVLTTQLLTSQLNGQQTRGVKGDDIDQLVPQQLLGLVHAPEVQQELGLSDSQVDELEKLFEEIDGEWFRVRIQPLEKQFAVISALEQRVRSWFQDNTTAAQQKRLQELEYRAQGVRMILRSDLAQQLDLDANQRAKLAQLAVAKNKAVSEMQTATMKNEVTEKQKSAVAQATKAEQDGLKQYVRQDQVAKLTSLIGEPFDTASLTRIYPMAPELEPVQNWINSNGVTLKELRGKVVLLHFYAFQCSNCIANFDHYSQWHNKYSNDEVVVLGIQTPETPRERDPAAVRSAASQTQMQYPIMIDLESKNWDAWSNTMWPTVYVIDKQGYLRHWWQGELNWNGATGDKTIEDLVAKLIKEKA